MPRNGSGSYALPIPPTPFVTGTTISAPDMNTTLTDVGAALTGSVARDGQAPLTGNWPVGGYNITGIGNLTATTATFSGAVSIGSLSGVSTLSLATLTVTGAATIGTTLGVTGAITGGSTITATGAVSGAAQVVTGSSVPANGIYLPAANTVGVATNTTLRYSVNANGAVGIGSSPDYGTPGYVFTSAGSGAAPTWAAVPAGYSPTGAFASGAIRGAFPISANNFVVQAGNGTTDGSGDLTVTFGTAFGTACVAVVVSVNDDTVANNLLCFANNKTTSGFTAHTRATGGGSVSTVPVSWIAVGY